MTWTELDMTMRSATPLIHEAIVVSDAWLATVSEDGPFSASMLRERLLVTLRAVRDRSKIEAYKPWRYLSGFLVDALLYTDPQLITEPMLSRFHHWIRKLTWEALSRDDISQLKGDLILRGWLFTQRRQTNA